MEWDRYWICFQKEIATKKMTKNDPSQLTVCVYDNGVFQSLAQHLVGSFKRVLYYSNRRKGFVHISECVVGDGYEGVQRIDDIWKHKDEVNLWVFPDIDDSGLQRELELQGYLVWGSRGGDVLEINRQKFLSILQESGLNVPPHTKVTGLSNLKALLKDQEDKYIKVSKFRGTHETMHYRSWAQDEGWFDLMAVKLGPLKEHLPFIVFDKIETDLELGPITYCVDGKFPATMISGMEWKDAGSLSVVDTTKDMPPQIAEVMEAFGPILKEYRYRNVFGMEIRVKDDEGYFIDGCNRFPMPGTGSLLSMIGNWPEIMLAGAQGELVEPQWEFPVCAECVLTQKLADRQMWSCVDFPAELRPHIVSFNSCEVDGKICSPPDDTDQKVVGWLNATGESIEAAVEKLQGYVNQLPSGIKANTESMFNLLKEANEAEEQDIPLGDKPVPDPEIALTK